MKQNPLSKSLLSGLLLAGLVAFLLLYKPDVWGARYIKEMFELGHIPLFGLGALCILNILQRSKGGTLYAYVLAGTLTILLGVATEIIQIWQPGRYFQVSDLFHNVLGAAGFLCCHYIFYHREVRQEIRRGILVVFVLLIGYVSVPWARAAMDEYHMHRDFPVIGSFEREEELLRWWAPQAELLRTPLHATHGKYSLEVRLAPGTYPGISIRDMLRDWRSYEFLSMDLFVQGEEPLPLSVRINDKAHNEEYKDRFNRSFVLQPGPNQIRIPLEDVFNAPKTRTMDRTSMGILCIFSPHLKTTRTFHIDNIRLSN